MAFYFNEPGAEVVERYLESVKGGHFDGYLNIVNLTEFYYAIYRRDPAVADEKERNLRSLGLKIVPLEDDSLWREAGLLKAKNRLSLADAFAAATAKIMKAKLITGSDREFGKTGVSVIKVR